MKRKNMLLKVRVKFKERKKIDDEEEANKGE